MQIGAQIYTVRAFSKTKEDFAETLKKIADIGYKTIQLSGACEVEGEWLDNELKKNGLKCVLSHNSKEKLTTQTEDLVKYHNEFGCDYLGLGQFSFPAEALEEKYAEFVSTYKPVAEKIAALGKYFMYHNHAPEFQKIGNETIMQKIANDFSPEILGFTLDTYWVQVGGGDAAWWLENLKGRVPVIHLKDCAFGQKMSVIGEGNMNFDAIFKSAEKAGTKYMLVEQDNCNGEDPFECLKRSYNYLKSKGFE